MALDEADWKALAELLAPHQLQTARAEYPTFGQQTGTPDRDLFLQYLHRQAVITDEQLSKGLRIRLRPELLHVSVLEDPSQWTPPPGEETSPGGQYAFLGVIGQGAMGAVWVAKDRSLCRKVAFKELDADRGAQYVARQRFVSEAQITAQLDHPNIPPVYSLEIGSGRVGYAMKLVEGRTLRDWLGDCYEARASGRPSPIPLSERLEWFLKVCDAVSYAHSREVLHRDLKPENVMIGPFGEVWVMDWGLARIAGDPVSAAPRPRAAAAFADSFDTQVGEGEGTPANMSPEQARGDRDLGPSSDQYALGLLLQEIVTLAPPVRVVDAHLARLAAVKGQREPLPRGVPTPLRAIIGRSCAVEPRRRYPSVAALAGDVRRYLRDDPIVALPEGPLRSVWRGLVRHRERVLMAGFLVLLVGVVVAVTSLNFAFVERWAAATRQERLGGRISRIGEQAHRIDKAILEYDRRLEVVAGSATQLLAHAEGRPDAVLYDSASFADPARRPPDLAADLAFGMPVSHAHPVVHGAPGTPPETVRAAGARLALLESELARQSGPDAPPVGWTFVGTESGVHVSWPGHGGLAADFDPRQRPWYRQARETDKPIWGAPYVDAGGLGFVVPCSRALRGPSGELLGVAGLDVPLRHVIDDMLVPAALPIREAWLLDAEGRILVSSLQGHAATEPAPRFPDDRVVADARAQRTSTSRRADGTWYLAYPLSAVGWSYVVAVDESVLLRE
jgi:serine/threonine protein kinase